MFKYWLKRRSKIKELDLQIVNKRTAFWKPFLMIAPALVIITLFILIPFVMAARDSFQSYPSAHDKGSVIWTFNSYKSMFADAAFKNAIYNTVVYALIAVPLLIIISVVISAVIAGFIRKRVRGIWQTIFFLPYITSAIAIAFAFSYIFEQDRGLVNLITGQKTPWLKDSFGHHALVPILVTGIWKGIAFNILIFTTAILGVNKNLYKAAAIDGASPTKQFFTITLPAIRKSMSFLIFMAITGSTKVFPLALFNNRPDEAIQYNGTTLMLYIYYQVKEGSPFKAGAGSISLVILSIALTVVLRGGIYRLIGIANFLKERHVQNKIMIKTKI